MTGKISRFNAKKLRKEYFSKYFPYDNELATIVKNEREHDFLVKPLWQNMHIYLVEYLIAFCKKWFGKNDFKVLDWGCGKGEITYLCKKRHIKIECCDIADKKYGDSAFGQKTPIIDHEKINVIPLEHTVQLPFENESFDAVLSFGVLEHVSNDMESLKEISRILKPRGLFFCFFLPYKYSWKQKRQHLKGSFYHDHLYDMKTVKYLLDNAGFTLSDYWNRDLFPKRFAPVFYRQIENMDNWICGNTVLKHLASNIEFVAYKGV
jgi:SAM-dependent methyltransferase